MHKLPKLIAFDLDDTISPSKTPATPHMLELLIELLKRTEVAIISGGNFKQFETQLIDPLTEKALEDHGHVVAETLLASMHLLPTCGTRFYQREGSKWVARYEENLSVSERAAAVEALEQEARRLGFWEADTWGKIIEDRASQITFSALGQRAPVEAKELWDPAGEKKNALRIAVQERLPDLEVRSGGSTSVDITRKGIDKAYGMNKLQEHTGICLSDMFFVGDRLDPDGNDYPVKAMGVSCHAVSGWQDTQTFLEELLA